jgi:NADPH:quinone reductase-like Zn-dependent oxidoreductase
MVSAAGRSCQTYRNSLFPCGFPCGATQPRSPTATPAEAKIEATHALNQALEAGWQGLDIAETVPLDQIARAHELVEHPAKPGRVIVAVAGA